MIGQTISHYRIVEKLGGGGMGVVYTILEGSQEWDILYRKYYTEEVKKLGV